MKQRVPTKFSTYLFILLALFGSSSTCLAQTYQKMFYDSIRSPWVYGPTLAALGLVLSGVDGKITDYATEQRPIFNNVQDAKQFSDNVAFYYLPVYSAVTTAIYSYKNTESRSHKFFQYTSFLPSPILSYGLNAVLKDRSGRLRPDGSNNQSFPSAHTTLASSLTQFSRHNMKKLTRNSHVYDAVTIPHELLVVGVAWARLEARKHHLSDVLVGYSIGKFFSNFFHKLIFGNSTDSHISFLLSNPENIGVQAQWSF